MQLGPRSPPSRRPKSARRQLEEDEQEAAEDAAPEVPVFKSQKPGVLMPQSSTMVSFVSTPRHGWMHVTIKHSCSTAVGRWSQAHIGPSSLGPPPPNNHLAGRSWGLPNQTQNCKVSHIDDPSQSRKGYQLRQTNTEVQRIDTP